jgi:hypothetical protein
MADAGLQPNLRSARKIPHAAMPEPAPEPPEMSAQCADCHRTVPYETDQCPFCGSGLCVTDSDIGRIGAVRAGRGALPKRRRGA